MFEGQSKGRTSSAIRVAYSALEAAEAAARNATPDETGGILLGWRTDGTIYISDALLVPDDQAGSFSYQRSHAAAQAVLDAYIAHRSDPNIGYVGEWHTHPLPLPPSPIDIRSLRLAARGLTDPIALLVIALSTDKDATTTHVLVASQARFNRISITALDVQVEETDVRTGEPQG